MNDCSSRQSQYQPWCPCHAVQQDLHGRLNPILISKTSPKLQADKYYCHLCIQIALQDVFTQHEKAREDHEQRRLWCAGQINRIRTSSAVLYPPLKETGSIESDQLTEEAPSPLQRLSEDQDILIQLRSRLSRLQFKCNRTAMDLAKLSYQNEERVNKINQQKETIEAAQHGFHKLFHTVISSNADELFSNNGYENNIEEDCGLNYFMQRSIHQARKLRFKLALQVFDMFQIDVGQEYAHLTSLSSFHPNDPQTIVNTDTINSMENKNRQDRLLHKKIPNGIGKISGLPLPHAGPSLYGMMPSTVLTSSLRLVATLTTFLSKCLGISLPHPIMLHPLLDPSYKMKEDGDIIYDRLEDSSDYHKPEDFVTLQDIYRLGNENAFFEKSRAGGSNTTTITTNNNMISPKRTLSTDTFSNTISSTSSSFLSLMKSSSSKITRSAHKVLDKVTGHTCSDKHQEKGRKKHEVIPTMDNDSVKYRLSYALSAKVCETIDSKKGQLKKITSNPNSFVTYDLRLPQSSSFMKIETRDEMMKLQENFTIALELLQNNIVGLCVHSGVPISTLWPAEALLLNLYSLMLYCREEASGG